VFKVSAFLADAAQVMGGKLYVLGGGWSVIVPRAPFAVCGKIDIPWSRGTDWHNLRLELVDGDGQPVMIPQGDGERKPLPAFTPPRYRATIPPHVKPGTPLDWPFVLTIGPGLPLEPGSLYEWRITINGHTQDGWNLPFYTAPKPLAEAA
jgi:hypothetical protein